MHMEETTMRTDKFVLIGMIVGLLSIGAPAVADRDADCIEADTTPAFSDALIEGRLWATYALNQHLNPFDIKVDVKGDTVTLEGQVDEEVKKDLAGQIALSIDDIEKVDNRIQVVDEVPETAMRVARDGERGFGDRVRDATTTASVKSKLLWNRNTAGLAIKVSTENGIVRLEGEADSSASRELAERLAANTDGVDEVINDIKVKA